RLASYRLVSDILQADRGFGKPTVDTALEPPEPSVNSVAQGSRAAPPDMHHLRHNDCYDNLPSALRMLTL
ncbi:MAG: hypothetical protein QGF24_07805, partial [Dehalococcoidia bacterium]|nr:hypothetical protein [Dehalococcoidia bacterium]